jgi:hypothetical protein
MAYSQLHIIRVIDQEEIYEISGYFGCEFEDDSHVVYRAG